MLKDEVRGGDFGPLYHRLRGIDMVRYLFFFVLLRALITTP